MVVFVTGGSRGIGAAIVRRAAVAGHAVAFSYRVDRAAAEALQRSLAETGTSIVAVQGDVADADFAARCFDTVSAVLGPPTALVNNAGITGRYGAFADLAPDVLRRTFDVNVIGALLTAQSFVQRWLASGVPGRIVNLSSAAATLGSPGEYVHYAASKGAIDSFTIGLGKELAAQGIRVNAVAAGTVHTDIHAAGGAPDRPARVVGKVPMQRIAQPEEIAATVLWLLSDEASYVTGTVVRAAGGL